MNVLKNKRKNASFIRTVSAKIALASVTTAAILLAVSCGDRSDKPVYEPTPERLYLGSIYYSKSGCADCHGPEWDGQGPGAGKLEGAKPTDFTAKVAGEKTPLSYFKALTDPASYFGNSDLEAEHKRLTFTDRGRWAIANFLFQMGQPPEDQGKRSQALAKMQEELDAVYTENRRWQMGFPTVEERKEKPQLAEMLKKASTVASASKEEPVAPVSEARKMASQESGRGSEIYYGSCAECHGQYGEGRKDRYGLTGMIPIESGFPRVDELKRQTPVFITTGDLAKSGSLGSQESFKNAHSGVNLIAPGMKAYTSEEWGALYSFTRRLAGK